MDESVQLAMAKWPNVPECYGWLRLNPRGHWFIPSGQIHNPHLTAFIARNYEADEKGRWFFQNGPQRVFVDLDAAPYVLRYRDGVWSDHLGTEGTMPAQFWLTESGSVYAPWRGSIGIVDDRDLGDVCDIFAQHNLDLESWMSGQDAALASMRFEHAAHAELNQKFGIEVLPRLPGQPEGSR